MGGSMERELWGSVCGVEELGGWEGLPAACNICTEVGRVQLTVQDTVNGKMIGAGNMTGAGKNDL